MKITNPLAIIHFDDKPTVLSPKSENFIFTLDHLNNNSEYNNNKNFVRDLLMTFNWGGSYISSRLKFVDKKLECVKFARMENKKRRPIKLNCYNNFDINFGYYSIYAKVIYVNN